MVQASQVGQVVPESARIRIHIAKYQSIKKVSRMHAQLSRGQSIANDALRLVLGFGLMGFQP